MPRMRIDRCAPLVVSGLIATACAHELPTSAIPHLTITPVNWSDTLVVGDDSMLTVRITDPNGAVVTGLSITWRSNNDSVLQIIPDSGNAAGPNAMPRVHLRANAAGSATISIVPLRVGGQVQTGDTMPSRTITVLENWHTVGAGAGFTCALNTRKEAYCWGDGLNLGNGTTVSSSVPVPVVNITGLTLTGLSVGINGACVSVLQGLWYCWGTNIFGELGNGTLVNAFIPTALQTNFLFSVVAIGEDHGCGLSADAVVTCWGFDQQGQLGNGEVDTAGRPFGLPAPHTTATACPVDTVGGINTAECYYPGVLTKEFTALSVGGDHSCALTLSGVAYCWGNNVGAENGVVASRNIGPNCQYGLNGDNFPCDSVATAVTGRMAFGAISAGFQHTCAIEKTNQVIYCWGTNDFGELGATSNETCNGDPDYFLYDIPREPAIPCSSQPLAVSAPGAFLAVGAGEFYSCGLNSTGSVYCWGANTDGELGDGTTTNHPAPVAVIGGLRFDSLSVGYDHACALTPRGAAYCWGANGFGQLGHGDSVARAQPTRVMEHVSRFP